MRCFLDQGHRGILRPLQASALHLTIVPMRPSPCQAQPAPRPGLQQCAAAASFAALTDSLDYLDAASIEQVRQAYRFADEAHLGQLRKRTAIPTSPIPSPWRRSAPNGNSTPRP